MLSALGVANTGFLPTNVTAKAKEIDAVLPVCVEVESSSAVTTIFCWCVCELMEPFGRSRRWMEAPLFADVLVSWRDASLRD